MVHGCHAHNEYGGNTQYEGKGIGAAQLHEDDKEHAAGKGGRGVQFCGAEDVGLFGSLTILFVLLALGDFTGNHTITMIAGFEGIFCGLSAIYSAMGQILNEEYKKTIFPLG